MQHEGFEHASERHRQRSLPRRADESAQQQREKMVASVAVMISTVSTVSEQERNGQGRRETVGKSVHVRQAMQLKTLIT